MSADYARSHASLKFSIEPIGDSGKKISGALQHTIPEALPQGATATVGSLRWAHGSSKAAMLYYLPAGAKTFNTQEFNARHNLDRVLAGGRGPLSPSDRAATKSALERMRARSGESLEEWADKLSMDLAQFRD